MMSADDLIDRVKLVNSLMDAIFLSILVSTIPLTVAINVDRREVSHSTISTASCFSTVVNFCKDDRPTRDVEKF